MPIPYASSIPIAGGMQMPRDDGMGTTPDGRARAEAMRRLLAKAPGTDHQSAMQQLPAQMEEERGAASATGPTVLQPSRTQAFSTRDAQSLAAVDPRALQEANALAALDKPKTMTGTFGGRSFEMTPSARVDRNALARLYAQAQERKGQEREDSVRGQVAKNAQDLVRIPGDQGIKKREMELGTEERITGKKLEADAPARAADIAAKNAQTAAITGGETRAQAQAARQPTPQQEAIDAAYAQAVASPFAQTPEGRKRIAALYRQSTAGKALPPEDAAMAAEGAAGPGPDIGAAAAEVMADPGIAAIIARVKETKPGMISGSRDRQTNVAARALAERAIKARLARSGVTPEEAQEIVVSILGPNDTVERGNLLVGQSAGGLSVGNANAAIRPR